MSHLQRWYLVAVVVLYCGWLWSSCRQEIATETTTWSKKKMTTMERTQNPQNPPIQLSSPPWLSIVMDCGKNPLITQWARLVS